METVLPVELTCGTVLPFELITCETVLPGELSYLLNYLITSGTVLPVLSGTGLPVELSFLFNCLVCGTVLTVELSYLFKAVLPELCHLNRLAYGTVLFTELSRRANCPLCTVFSVELCCQSYVLVCPSPVW